MTNRTKFTKAQIAAVDEAIRLALDQNGATMKQGEVCAHAADYLRVDHPTITTAWDYRLLIGQRLQAMRRDGRAEFRKGPGSGWRKLP